MDIIKNFASHQGILPKVKLTNFSLENQIAVGIRESQQWPSLRSPPVPEKVHVREKRFSTLAQSWKMKSQHRVNQWGISSKDTGTSWWHWDDVNKGKKGWSACSSPAAVWLGYGCCPEHAWPSVCLHLSLWIPSTGCRPPPPMSELARHIDSIHFNITFFTGFIRAGH